MKSSIAFALLSTAAAAGIASPSSNDLARATAPLPRAHLTGNTVLARSRVLNVALETYDDLQTKPCEEYSMEELFTVMSLLQVATNTDLNDIYERSGDNRRLSKVPAGFPVSLDAELQDVTRDSLCIEAVMMYAHHLGEAEKLEFHELSSLPTMPSTERIQTDFSDEHTQVYRRLQEVRTCDICHADPAEILYPEAPAWADEFFCVLSLNSTSYDGVPGPFRAALRYYSWPLRAYRDERTIGGFTDVTMRKNGNLYMFTPHLQSCIVAPMDMEPVSPRFMQGEGAEYLGEEVYKDVPCEVWDKVDPLSGDEHKVWWAKSDGRPVKMFTSGGPNDISQKDYVAYEPKPIDASYFDIPDYCTSAGTRVMEPEELHAVVRERHLFF